MAAERPDPRRCRAVEARDPHMSPDDGHGRIGQRPDIEESRPPQVPDRDLDGPPRGLLHEQRADDRFEGGLGGPPVLGPVVLEEPLVDLLGAIHLAAAITMEGLRVVCGATEFKGPLAIRAHEPGPDVRLNRGRGQLPFRAINLAGTNPTLDLGIVLITALRRTYILAPFAVPLWFPRQPEATVDFVLI